MTRAAVAMLIALVASGCTRGDTSADNGTESMPARAIAVTITSRNGTHVFMAEAARTAPQQEQGLMYRTDLKPDGGMLFWPYPPDGGPPRSANFWMKNTPTPLDIVYIRGDGTIAHIAENMIPYSEAMIPSGEPISAVLEILGGRSAELGIAEGDRVAWKHER